MSVRFESVVLFWDLEELECLSDHREFLEEDEHRHVEDELRGQSTRCLDGKDVMSLVS
jgi:hypothetical protein